MNLSACRTMIFLLDSSMASRLGGNAAAGGTDSAGRRAPTACQGRRRLQMADGPRERRACTRWLLAMLGVVLVGPACASAGAEAVPVHAPALPARRAPLTPAPGVAGDADRGWQLFTAKGCG